MAVSETEYWQRFEGSVIDRKYHLCELLGTGTASGVFRAEHRIGGHAVRQVAIKLMQRDSHNERQQLDALAVALDLAHPNVLRCHDAGSALLLHTDLLYLVMEKAEQSLYGYLRNRPATAEEYRQIFLQIALGLNYLHTHPRRYVHRDIKLGNVLRVGSAWKLADFGIIFEMRDLTTVMTDINWGTYKFMSPEACDHKITPAWDVWSLGVLMVYCLTREYPFRKTEGKTLIESIRADEPHFAEPIPPCFLNIIQGCLIKDHPSRWTSAQVVESLIAIQSLPVPRRPAPLDLPPVSPPLPAAAPAVMPPVPRTQTGDIATRLPARKVNLKDGAEMVLIPAGPFQMGDPGSSVNPCHTVDLTDYYITKNAVTVRRYKLFCAATGRQMPPAPDFNRGWSKEDHPMVCVPWEDAQAYCHWIGGNLPTEAQWEKAARGTDGRTYPWGATWSLRRLQCSRDKLGDVGGTLPVGSFPTGASPYGVLDMAGNVWQWCADWFAPDFWSSRFAAVIDPENQSLGDRQNRVLRGGSWFFNNPLHFCCSYRNWNAPDLRLHDVGFRCVMRADGQVGK